MLAFTLFLCLFTQGVWGNYDWTGCDGPEAVRSKHDTFKKFMLVDTKNPFPCNGNVAKVKFFTGSNSDRSWSTDRGLKVGIFRSNGEIDCSFDVEYVEGLDQFPLEKHMYQAVVDFDVEAGDFFGFYWGNYGVVSFDWDPENTLEHTPNVEARTDSDRNHCGAKVGPPVANTTVQLEYAAASAKDSWSYRDYAIWFYICCEECVHEYGILGTDNKMPLPWPKHDTAKRFLQVDMRHSFPCNGEVTGIFFYTGSDSDRPWSDNRGLKFGVYKAITEGDCDFEVKALEGLGQFPDRNVQAGVQELYIPVEKGENWGFYWKNYGVVSFDWLSRDIDNSADNNNYCGADTNPDFVGNTVNLHWGDVNSKDSTGHRDYAIWVNYHCCI